MATAPAASRWLRGRVKAVPSGDTLVIMGSTKTEMPPEKTITLSHVITPRLARRGTIDEPFAWDNREFLRKLCIGKVKEQGPKKGEASPALAELLHLAEQAKPQELGPWSKVPGASEVSIKNLPPSAIGDPSNLYAMELLAANKGKPMPAIVEQVRDGSTVRVYLLPEFLFVQVFIAGIQAPSMGRRVVVEATPGPEVIADDADGEVSVEIRTQPTSA